MTKTPPKFREFKMVRKPLPEKKPYRAPKREVLSRDILRTLPEPKAKKIEKASQSVKHPEIEPAAAELTFVTANFERVLPKTTFWKIVPALIIFGLILGSVHGAVYLKRAKEASGLVLGAATSAYADLDMANQSLSAQDFASARDQFTAAQQDLISAQGELEKFRLLIMLAPPAKGADDILSGAYFLAEAGKNLTKAVQLFDELSVTSAGISTENFTDKLRHNHGLLKTSLMMIGYAREKFDGAKGLPDEYQQSLAEGKEKMLLLEMLLTDLVNLEDLYLSFFGSEPRTYLLAFQNYDEIRATGGFIGTYGSLKYENGEIKKLKIESIYNLDGSLTKQIAAPGPFQPDIKKWAMRDANWFVDFPTSARKLLEFYEMEHETADGIIALTPRMFEDVLRLTGPIEMPQYDVTLTPENFQETVQIKTSVDYDKKLNQPKKFLDDFAPVMLNRLSSLKKEQWLVMFQMMKDNFLQKHVMVYSTDQDTQGKIAKMGFDGAIKPAEHDYLAVFNSNHGGTKTDLDMEQSIGYKSVIGSDGTVTNHLTITRRNTSDMSNLSFMRVLVPLGSQLSLSDGFMDKEQFQSASDGFATDPDLAAWDQGSKVGNALVRTEAGKTEFTGWVQTLGNASSTVTISYKLPFTVKTGLFNPSQGHSLVFQKQPGSKDTQIEGSWIFDGRSAKWATGNVNLSSGKASFNGLGKTDESWGLILGR